MGKKGLLDLQCSGVVDIGSGSLLGNMSSDGGLARENVRFLRCTRFYCLYSFLVVSGYGKG